MEVKGVMIQWMSDEDEQRIDPADFGGEGTPIRTFIRFDTPMEFDLINTPTKLEEWLIKDTEDRLDAASPKRPKWDESEGWEEVGYEMSEGRITGRHTRSMDASIGDFTSPYRDMTIHPVWVI